MNGFVSQEKEKFERLARHMKYQQKDLQTKSAQIAQVKELIRNSPRIGRTPLREAQTGGLGGVAVTPGGKNVAPPVKGKVVKICVRELVGAYLPVQWRMVREGVVQGGR